MACKICNDKKLPLINRMILDNAPNTAIVKRFGYDPRTIKKHKKNCISESILKTAQAREIIASSALLENVESKIEMMDKLIEGCADYLVDPDDPNKYFLGARGSEIQVVYQEINENGKPGTLQKKATLQALLDAISEDGHYIVMNTTIKHSDPRDLLLKGISELKSVAKMLIDASQVVIEHERLNLAYERISKEGGSISIEKEISSLTERITIALKGSNTEELSKLAGLPDLD